VKADRRWTPYVLVAPAVLVFAFVVLIPAILNTALSVMDWSGTDQMRFVGLDNFFRAFRDDIYLMAYRNTFLYIGMTLVLEVLVGLVLAGLVTMRGTRTAFYRIAFFVPVMLPMVVIAVLWSFVYSDDIGLINTGLRGIGLDEWAPVWLGDPSTALIAVSVVSGWIYAGFYMAIFYAALQRIPQNLVDAARLDGASYWKLFTKIAMPLSIPSFIIIFLFEFQASWNNLQAALIYLNAGGVSGFTVPLGISYAMTTFSPTNGGHGDYQYVMVASLIVTLPMLLLFAFGQRYFIEGVATQGRKG